MATEIFFTDQFASPEMTLSDAIWPMRVSRSTRTSGRMLRSFVWVRGVLGTQLDRPLWGTPTGLGTRRSCRDKNAPCCVAAWASATEPPLAAAPLAGSAWAVCPGRAFCRSPYRPARFDTTAYAALKQTGTSARDKMRRSTGKPVVNPSAKFRDTQRRRCSDRICRALPCDVTKPDPGSLLLVWFDQPWLALVSGFHWRCGHQLCRVRRYGQTPDAVFPAKHGAHVQGPPNQ